MDRRQTVIQRAKEFFNERLDDVLEMARRDRQEMRGWQEPAHVRAAARRQIRQENSTSVGYTSTETAPQFRTIETDFGRAAGEPDPGQQREAIGLLLDAGIAALEKLGTNSFDLSPEEAFGLETILLLYGRPAILINQQGSLGSPPPLWNILEDQREEVELLSRGVGRIELLGHPEYDWAGTGFLVAPGVLMTTRRVAETFAENRTGNWQFRPGITAWMDFRSNYQGPSPAGFQVRGVIGVHPSYDLALLEVERSQFNGNNPTPLPLAAQPFNLSNRPAYLVGYPIRDARRNDPEMVTRIFRDVFNVKRVQPGLLQGEFCFGEVRFLRHDCAPLGQTSGAPLIDLETNQVVGMQLTSRYLESATAVPLYALQDDPLFRSAGISFAVPLTQQERNRLNERLERLARTPYFGELRQAIDELYNRAFRGEPGA